MKKAKFVLLLFLVSVMCSCTTTKYYSLQDKYNQNYRNATRNDIYRICGAPSRVVNMDKGEYIIVYERYETQTTSNSYSATNANANANAGSYYSNNQSYANVYGNSNTYSGNNTRTSNNRYYTEFYMNSNDRCYSVRTTDTYAKKETDVGMTVVVVIGSIVIGGLYIWLLSSL